MTSPISHVGVRSARLAKPGVQFAELRPCVSATPSRRAEMAELGEKVAELPRERLDEHAPGP